MSYAASVVTDLKADATLTAILTGGIYDYTGLGRKGLERIQTSGAFDPVLGLLKPICVALELDEQADYEAIHAPSGYMSTRTTLYLWVFDSGDRGYNTIESACAEIRSRLNFKRPAGSGMFLMYLTNTLKDKREPLLKDAAFWRLDFAIHGHIGT